jgi:DNA-binding response OmpR family regulator
MPVSDASTVGELAAGCVTADGAAAAFELSRSRQAHLVMLDVHLAGIDGFDP